MKDRKQLGRVALVLTAVVVMLVNLTPLQVEGSLASGLAELAGGLTLHSGDQVSISLVQRTLVYLPLGLLAYAVFHRRGTERPAHWYGPAFTRTVLLVAAVSLVVEILQAFVSVRHAFLTDALLVMAIGVLAALIGEIALGFAARRRRAFAELFVLGNVLVLSALLITRGGADLESWDCGYPLIIGNEATEDRPWRGRLRGLAIYPQALTDSDVSALSAGFIAADSKIRRHAMGVGLAVVFPEDDNAIREAGDRHAVADEGGHLGVADGTLEIDRPMLFEVKKELGGLCDQIKAADAFTIEAELASLALDQQGPARIVSMSIDQQRRNFTLGQDGGRLSLRIRNTVNGDNGIERQVFTEDGVLSGSWQHWIARYDQGVTTLFVDGVEVPPALDYESVILIGGHRSVHLALVSSLFSLFVGAAAFGWLGGMRRTLSSSLRAMVSTMLALSPQLASILAIGVTSARFPETSVLLAIVAATCLGVVGAWRLGLGSGDARRQFG
ncbi:MAG: VanZ family protein [Pseudomonadota bacterium]